MTAIRLQTSAEDVDLQKVVEEVGDGLAPIVGYLETIWATLGPQLQSIEGLVQLAAIVAAAIVAFALRGPMRRLRHLRMVIGRSSLSTVPLLLQSK